MDLKFSIIIPVYNRPVELRELLQSIADQNFGDELEVVVVEDGSLETSKHLIEEFKGQLKLMYFFKENSGPGLSRNFGMGRARGNYFVIFDSDCILPKDYFKNLKLALQKKYTDAFGGPDCAHKSFTAIQKAINYAMTSFLTTGGLRNSESVEEKFQLRSFNMGISRKAFEETGGFARQRIGEDIELTQRFWKAELSTQFIPSAFVYHKRRTTWKQFFNQVFNFGSARPILNGLFPGSAKLSYFFPSFFVVGLILGLLFLLFGFPFLIIFYGIYFLFVFIDSFFKNRSIEVGLLSIWAVLIQFFGYGLGFLKSWLGLTVSNKKPDEVFPKMFR